MAASRGFFSKPVPQDDAQDAMQGGLESASAGKRQFKRLQQGVAPARSSPSPTPPGASNDRSRRGQYFGDKSGDSPNAATREAEVLTKRLQDIMTLSQKPRDESLTGQGAATQIGSFAENVKRRDGRGLPRDRGRESTRELLLPEEDSDVVQSKRNDIVLRPRDNLGRSLSLTRRGDEFWKSHWPRKVKDSVYDTLQGFTDQGMRRTDSRSSFDFSFASDSYWVRIVETDGLARLNVDRRGDADYTLILRFCALPLYLMEDDEQEGIRAGWSEADFMRRLLVDEDADPETAMHALSSEGVVRLLEGETQASFDIPLSGVLAATPDDRTYFAIVLLPSPTSTPSAAQPSPPASLAGQNPTRASVESVSSGLPTPSTKAGAYSSCLPCSIVEVVPDKSRFGPFGEVITDVGEGAAAAIGDRDAGGAAAVTGRSMPGEEDLDAAEPTTADAKMGMSKRVDSSEGWSPTGDAGYHFLEGLYFAQSAVIAKVTTDKRAIPRDHEVSLTLRRSREAAAASRNNLSVEVVSISGSAVPVHKTTPDDFGEYEPIHCLVSFSPGQVESLPIRIRITPAAVKEVSLEGAEDLFFFVGASPVYPKSVAKMAMADTPFAAIATITITGEKTESPEVVEELVSPGSPPQEAIGENTMSFRFDPTANPVQGGHRPQNTTHVTTSISFRAAQHRVDAAASSVRLTVHRTVTISHRRSSIASSTAGSGSLVVDVSDPNSSSFRNLTTAEREVAQAALAQTILVRFSTKSGSAEPTTDYVDAAGMLTFPPGETLLNVDVTILPDGGRRRREDKEFSVRLYAAQVEDVATARQKQKNKQAAAQAAAVNSAQRARSGGKSGKPPLKRGASSRSTNKRSLTRMGSSEGAGGVRRGKGGSAKAVVDGAKEVPPQVPDPANHKVVMGKRSETAVTISNSSYLSCDRGSEAPAVIQPPPSRIVAFSRDQELHVVSANLLDKSSKRDRATGYSILDVPIYCFDLEDLVTNNTTAVSRTGSKKDLKKQRPSLSRSMSFDAMGHGLPVVARFETVDGDAVGGVDFEPSHGAIVFHPGERQHTISVVILHRSQRRGPSFASDDGFKSFFLRVSQLVPKAQPGKKSKSSSGSQVSDLRPQYCRIDISNEVVKRVSTEFLVPPSSSSVPSGGASDRNKAVSPSRAAMIDDAMAERRRNLWQAHRSKVHVIRAEVAAALQALSPELFEETVSTVMELMEVFSQRSRRLTAAATAAAVAVSGSSVVGSPQSSAARDSWNEAGQDRRSSLGASEEKPVIEAVSPLVTRLLDLFGEFPPVLLQLIPVAAPGELPEPSELGVREQVLATMSRSAPKSANTPRLEHPSRRGGGGAGEQNKSRQTTGGRRSLWSSTPRAFKSKQENSFNDTSSAQAAAGANPASVSYGVPAHRRTVGVLLKTMRSAVRTGHWSQIRTFALYMNDWLRNLRVKQVEDVIIVNTEPADNGDLGIVFEYDMSIRAVYVQAWAPDRRGKAPSSLRRSGKIPLGAVLMSVDDLPTVGVKYADIAGAFRRIIQSTNSHCLCFWNSPVLLPPATAKATTIPSAGSRVRLPSAEEKAAR
uniref:Calx-beta domain-containing protein n=1 Tax=Rhizochromulina marina TaxID=1034831 RepID=A0A7S2W6F8_9STRA|mmetsp:Transcript_15811/g.46533  ORF Transcript_15811/g.46533 Transcript_15811/m.46533 type:complete len:1565 (+) Transcript_15811:85-4779(+)